MSKNTVLGGNPLEPIHGFDGATTGEIIQSAVLVKESTDTPLPSSTTRGLLVNTAGISLASGRSTIATAGTAAQLNGGGSVACKSVFVCALPTNTSRVVVGDATVDAADSTFVGIPLDPLQGVSIDIGNVNLIYFDVLGDGHGVSWTSIG